MVPAASQACKCCSLVTTNRFIFPAMFKDSAHCNSDSMLIPVDPIQALALYCLPLDLDPVSTTPAAASAYNTCPASTPVYRLYLTNPHECHDANARACKSIGATSRALTAGSRGRAAHAFAVATSAGVLLGLDRDCLSCA